jgi:hypothetical protein
MPRIVHIERLPTRPSLTGSSLMEKTIGIVAAPALKRLGDLAGQPVGGWAPRHLKPQ